MRSLQVKHFFYAIVNDQIRGIECCSQWIQIESDQSYVRDFGASQRLLVTTSDFFGGPWSALDDAFRFYKSTDRLFLRSEKYTKLIISDLKSGLSRKRSLSNMSHLELSSD